MTVTHAIRAPVPAVNRKTPIVWGVPADELMFSRWAMYLWSIPRHPEDQLVHIIGTYVPFARNQIHQEFLRSEYDWLFMLDSDVCPPLSIVDTLLGHGLKCVSGWYNTKRSPKAPAVYKQEYNADGTPRLDAFGIPTWTQYDKPGTGLEKVDGIGMGVMLMHRSVAEALGEKPYSEERGGEDLDLCVQIRAKGFDVWCDWAMSARHVGIAVF